MIALAAADSNSYVDTLMAIVEILLDEKKSEMLLNAESSEQIYNVFQQPA